MLVYRFRVEGKDEGSSGEVRWASLLWCGSVGVAAVAGAMLSPPFKRASSMSTSGATSNSRRACSGNGLASRVLISKMGWSTVYYWCTSMDRADIARDRQLHSAKFFMFVLGKPTVHNSVDTSANREFKDSGAPGVRGTHGFGRRQQNMQRANNLPVTSRLPNDRPPLSSLCMR